MKTIAAILSLGLILVGCDEETKSRHKSSAIPSESVTLALDSCPNAGDLCVSGTITLDLDDSGSEVPTEGASVEVEDDPTVSTITGPSGAFVLAISAPDSKLTLLDDGSSQYERYKSRTFNVIAKYEKDGKKFAKRIPNLTFLGGKILALGNIKLEETGAIQGSVSLIDGANPLGIDIYIPGTSFTAKASETGSFLILYVPAGKYDLIYEKDGYHFKSQNEFTVLSKRITFLDPVALQPIVVDTEPPVTPVPKLVSDELTNDPSPTLSWSQSSQDTAYYELQVDTLSSFNSTNLRRFTEIKLLEQEVIPQLSDGLWYYRTRAVDYSGNASEWSTALIINVDTQPEGVPVTNLFPTPTNDSTPLFSWEAVTGAVGYHILVAKDAQFTDIVIDTKDPTGVSYTPTSTLDDRLYYWKAASIDAAGNVSQYSLPKSFEVDSILPDSPIVNAVSSPTNDTTPTITWSAVTGAVKYRVQIDDNSMFTSPFVDDASITINSYTSTAVSDRKWYFRVATIDSANNQSGFSVTKDFIVDTTPPDLPTLIPVSPDPTNDKTPLLRWNAGNGVPVSWDLEIDNTSSFLSVLQSQTGLIETKFQVTSLLPTGPIYWRVRQRDEAGNLSAWSSVYFDITDAATNAIKYDFSHDPIVSDRTLVLPVLRSNTDLLVADIAGIRRFSNFDWTYERARIDGNAEDCAISGSLTCGPTSAYLKTVWIFEPANTSFRYGNSRIAQWTGSYWQIEAISDNCTSNPSDAAIDSSGNIHFVYKILGELRYQIRSGGICSAYEVIDDIDNTGNYARIALISDEPQVIYNDNTEGVRKLAKKVCGSWSIIDTDLPSNNETNVEFKYEQNERIFRINNSAQKSYNAVSDSTWVAISTSEINGIYFNPNSSPYVYDAMFLKYVSGMSSTITIHGANTSKLESHAYNKYGNSFFIMKYVSFDERYFVSSYPIYSIDSGSGGIGKHTSIKYGTSKPSISYYDSGNQILKFSSFSGETWSVDTVDSSSQVGEYTSLTLYADGDPGISYYDANLGNLKYAFNDNGNGWTLEVVDNDTNVGMFTSSVINSADKPKISYYDVGNGNLKYASYNGASWELETVDSAGDVGQHTSLKLQPTTEYPSIAYYDVTNGDLKYAQYNGATWDLETVDSSGNVGKHASLELRDNGDPVILYYDAINKWLKIAEKDGGSWTIQTVTYAPSNAYGEYCDLVIDSENNIHISFYDAENTNLIYGFSDNTQWGFKIADGANVEDGNVVGESVYDFTGDVGKWSSIQLRQDNGAPGISYFDETEGILKYVEGVVLY